MHEIPNYLKFGLKGQKVKSSTLKARLKEQLKHTTLITGDFRTKVMETFNKSFPEWFDKDKYDYSGYGSTLLPTYASDYFDFWWDPAKFEINSYYAVKALIEKCSKHADKFLAVKSKQFWTKNWHMLLLKYVPIEKWYDPDVKVDNFVLWEELIKNHADKFDFWWRPANFYWNNRKLIKLLLKHIPAEKIFTEETKNNIPWAFPLVITTFLETIPNEFLSWFDYDRIVNNYKDPNSSSFLNLDGFLKLNKSFLNHWIGLVFEQYCVCFTGSFVKFYKHYPQYYDKWLKSARLGILKLKADSYEEAKSFTDKLVDKLDEWYGKNIIIADSYVDLFTSVFITTRETNKFFKLWWKRWVDIFDSYSDSDNLYIFNLRPLIIDNILALLQNHVNYISIWWDSKYFDWNAVFYLIKYGSDYMDIWLKDLEKWLNHLKYSHASLHYDKIKYYLMCYFVTYAMDKFNKWGYLFEKSELIKKHVLDGTLKIKILKEDIFEDHVDFNI